MSLKSKLNAILENNPLKKARINRMRKKLMKKDITLFTPNCLGGILFHDLGLQFLSPTVNLMLTQKDFLEFVLNLDDYLSGEFEFFKHNEHCCPCACLTPKNGDKKITIVFTHYHSEQEALDKWNARKERINKDNIFIFMQERDGVTKEDIQKLANLNVRGVVVFTCDDYKDIPYTVFVDKYKNDDEVGNILKKNHITGSREYEKYFDFVKWFNEADGAPYNVVKFR